MMNRTIKLYIFLLVLIVIGVIYAEANRPKPINWNPTYSVKDKIPFGLYVFDKESDKLFNSTVEKINVTPYEFLTDQTYTYNEEENYEYDEYYDEYTSDSLEETVYTYDESESDSLIYTDYDEYNIYKQENQPIKEGIKGNFISINNWIDEESVKQLMQFVSKGNSVFLSSDEFSQKLLDTLKLDVEYSYFSYKDSTRVYLSNPKLEQQKYNITVGSYDVYFNKIDTLNTLVLGYQYKDSLKAKEVNFVKASLGKGNFYLHLQPTIFTNYHLLKNENYKLAENTLSYLPKNQKVYWYTKGRIGEVVNQSPLRVIFDNDSLRYGWYILIFTGIIFLIFNVKRKQRIVPIIKPLENTTVDFTKTIGNLYYQQKDHGSIIDKKITYLLEKIRTQYMLDTKVLDEEFVKRFQLKSGKKEEDIQKVVDLINRHKKYGSASEEDLIALNRAIEKIS